MNIKYVCIQCSKSFIAQESKHRKYCSRSCFCRRINMLGRRYQRVSKLTFPLTMEVINYLDGLLLGDGNIQKPKNHETTRFKIVASKGHLDYLYEIKEKLKSYGIESTITPYDHFDKRTNKTYSGNALQSKCYITMLEIRKRWYKDVKFIPQDIELTKNVLRDWYVGDGHCRLERDTIQLSTDSFSQNDIVLLCNKLEKLGFSPRTSQRRIYLYIEKQVDKFLSDVGVLTESFKYKEKKTKDLNTLH